MEFTKFFYKIHKIDVTFMKYGITITVQVDTEKWSLYNFIPNLYNVIKSNEVDVENCEFQVLKLYTSLNDTPNTNNKISVWGPATFPSIEYDINCLLNSNFSLNSKIINTQKKETLSDNLIKYPYTIIKKMKIHHKITHLL